MRTFLLAGIMVIIGGFASAASAYNGYASGNVNMRVGPGPNYHRIATIPRGAAITIHGCLNGYRWCDVTYRGHRGWSYSRYVQAARYRHEPQPYWNYAPRVRTPVIVYDRPRYFRRHYYHYRDRPWYHYGGIYNVPRHRYYHRDRYHRGGIYLGFGF